MNVKYLNNIYNIYMTKKIRRSNNRLRKTNHKGAKKRRAGSSRIRQRRQVAGADAAAAPAAAAVAAAAAPAAAAAVAAAAAPAAAAAVAAAAAPAAAAALFGKLATASTVDDVTEVLREYTDRELSEALKGLDRGYSIEDLTDSFTVFRVLVHDLFERRSEADDPRQNIGAAVVTDCKKIIEDLHDQGVENMAKEALFKRITDLKAYRNLDPRIMRLGTLEVDLRYIKSAIDRRIRANEPLDFHKKVYGPGVGDHTYPLANRLLVWLFSIEEPQPGVTPPPPEEPRLGDDSCRHALDGYCDEPDVDPNGGIMPGDTLCRAGTDCTDCRTCPTEQDKRDRKAAYDATWKPATALKINHEAFNRRIKLWERQSSRR